MESKGASPSSTVKLKSAKRASLIQTAKSVLEVPYLIVKKFVTSTDANVFKIPMPDMSGTKHVAWSTSVPLQHVSGIS